MPSVFSNPAWQPLLIQYRGMTPPHDYDDDGDDDDDDDEAGLGLWCGQTATTKPLWRWRQRVAREREMLVGGDEGNDKREIDTSTICVLTATAILPFSCVNSTFLFHFSF
jgi:hypothetical protein